MKKKIIKMVSIGIIGISSVFVGCEGKTDDIIKTNTENIMHDESELNYDLLKELVITKIPNVCSILNNYKVINGKMEFISDTEKNEKAKEVQFVINDINTVMKDIKGSNLYYVMQDIRNKIYSNFNEYVIYDNNMYKASPLYSYVILVDESPCLCYNVKEAMIADGIYDKYKKDWELITVE